MKDSSELEGFPLAGLESLVYIMAYAKDLRRSFTMVLTSDDTSNHSGEFMLKYLFSQCMKMTVLVEITIINMVTSEIPSQMTFLMKIIFTKLFICLFIVCQ